MGPPPTASTSEAPAPRHAGGYDRKRTFHPSHARKFALEVATQDEASGAVTSVVCLFCRHFGREERPGKKRKATANFKYFRTSFRSDLYSQHHCSQHPKQWERYRACSDDAKRSFFPAVQRDWPPVSVKPPLVKHQVSTAAATLVPADRRCWFWLPKRLVDLVAPAGSSSSSSVRWEPRGFRVCELLPASTGAAADDDDANPSVAAAKREPHYRVALNGRAQLDVAVASLAAGLSPTQTARHLDALSRSLSPDHDASPLLPVSNVGDTRDLARLAVSESLHLTGRLLSRCWGFGLALRERTAAPSLPQAGYLDVRVVLYSSGRLRDVHLVALPLFERHAAFALSQTVEGVLDAVSPSWRSRLLGITQDGAMPVHAAATAVPATHTTSRSATHRSAELLALLEASVLTHTSASSPGSVSSSAPEAAPYRSWGACRQTTLALSAFYESLLAGGFLAALRSLTTHICRQPALLQEMGHPPSVAFDGLQGRESLELHAVPVDASRWLAMGRDTRWLTDKRVRLRKHLEQSVTPGATASATAGSHAGPVDDVWWVAFFVVHWVATRANEALRKLLEPRTPRAQQKAVIAELAAELVLSFHVQSGEEMAASASSSGDRRAEAPVYSRLGRFGVLKASMREFLGDLGIFVSNVVARVDPEALDVVLENVAGCLVNLVEALMELSDASADASPSEPRDLPPVLPHELAQLGGREFAALLQSHMPQLRAFMSEEELDNMDQEHQELRRAATRGTELRAALASCDALTPFAQAWKLTEGRFPMLQAFAGGLASAFAGRDAGSCREPLVGLALGGTSASAGDGSGDDTMCLPVADLALEATLHAQQLSALTSLVMALGEAPQPATISI